MAKAKLNNSGFTLIEMLVVTGLSSMLLLTISALFMTFLTGSAKSNIKRILNREGDNALKQMEHHIINANSVNCFSQSRIDITDINQQAKILQKNTSTNRMTLTEGAVTQNLTSDSIIVNNSDIFTCSPAGNKTFVDINLKLRKLDDSGNPVGLEETYSTSVQLRN